MATTVKKNIRYVSWNWNDTKSVKAAERKQAMLENKGYSFIETVSTPSGFCRSKYELRSKKFHKVTYSNGRTFECEAYDAKEAWAQAVIHAYYRGFIPTVHHIEQGNNFYHGFVFNWSTT